MRRSLKGIRSKDDIDILQQVLDKIYKWSDDNNMELNDTKFEGVSYGPDEDLKMQSKYKTPSGKDVSMKKTVKDLGVLLSNDCSFETHIKGYQEGEKHDIMDSSNFPNTFSSRCLFYLSSSTAPSYGHHKMSEVSKDLIPSNGASYAKSQATSSRTIGPVSHQ